MPSFPGEAAYRAERAAFFTTVAALPADTFEAGSTLCEGWAPRDVLAHLIGVDHAALEYVKAGGRVGSGNARIVAGYRKLDRTALLSLGRRWAAAPTLPSRIIGGALLGDVAVHHQDVLRPAGIAYALPRASARAILREGVVLGGVKLLTHRIAPDDRLARSLGRGRTVSGSTAALGLWLAGRRGLEPELTFG